MKLENSILDIKPLSSVTCIVNSSIPFMQQRIQDFVLGGTNLLFLFNEVRERIHHFKEQKKIKKGQMIKKI